MLILPYCNTRVRCAKVYSDCTSFMFSLHVLSSKGKKLKKKAQNRIGKICSSCFPLIQNYNSLIYIYTNQASLWLHCSSSVSVAINCDFELCTVLTSNIN
jgi:hypothetical protein